MAGGVQGVIERFQRALAGRGLRGTAALAAGLLKKKTKKWIDPTYWRGVAEERAFDRRHGIDTSGDFSPNEMGSTVLEGDMGYQGVHVLEFRKLMLHLRDVDRFSLDDATFVDIGSGKGRALLLAAEHPFRAVRGVEYWKELHDAAVRNLSQRDRSACKCDDVLSICGDAREFVFPDTPLVVFFYNPFSDEVLDLVLDRLLRAVDREKHRAAIVGILEPARSKRVDARPELRRTLDDGWHGIWRTI